MYPILRLNESGAIIVRGLVDGLSPEEIELQLIAEYEGVDAVTAKRAVADVIEKLRNEGLLES